MNKKLAIIIKNLVALMLLCCLSTALGCEDENAQPDYLEQAYVHMQNNNQDLALKAFEQYLYTSPSGEKRWEAWNYILKAALAQSHNSREPIGILDAMLMDFRNEPEHYRAVQEMLATQYARVRRYDQAVEIWSQLLADPDTSSSQKARSYRSLAKLYLGRLEFDTVIEALSYCLTLDLSLDEKALCQYDLADAYMIQDDYASVIKELRKLLAQDGVDENLRILSVFMLADALEQQGKPAEALALFESIRSVYPNSMVVQMRIEFLK